MWHVVTIDSHVSGPHATKREALVDNRLSRGRRRGAGLYEYTEGNATHTWAVFVGTADALRNVGMEWLLEARNV